MTKIPLTDLLARFSSGLELHSVPDGALDVARGCVIDLVAASLAGVSEPVSHHVTAFVKEENARPVATIFGGGFKSSAANAAFINGTSGHALDLDDVSPPLRGHPSVVCAPVALAAAEAGNSSGTEALIGYIAGVEVTINLAYAVGRNHYTDGWHSTATLGAIGAAATAARVFNLDVDKTRAALAIAASMSSGLRCNFGTMTKPLHAGHAAKCGLTAARLAAHGLTANSAAIEAPFGFLALHTDSAAVEDAAARLGHEWSILRPGINLKRHPCCYGAHHAIDAMLELCAEHALSADMIETIDALVAPTGLTAVIHDRPRTGLEGKFSIPYTLAAVLVDGGLTRNSFTDEQVLRPAVQSLIHKVRCHEAEGKPLSVEAPRFAEITVKLRDGRTLNRRCDHTRGSAAVPLTQSELDYKFRDCASSRLAPAAIERALQMLHEIDRLPNLDGLMSALTGPATH